MPKGKNDISEVGQNELSGHIIPLDTNIEEFFGGEISEFEKDRRKMLQDIEQAVSAFKAKYGVKELQIYCVNMDGMNVWTTNPPHHLANARIFSGSSHMSCAANMIISSLKIYRCTV